MATIELKKIQKNFGAYEAIKHIDLFIEDKEFMVFVGPSGCGKSTMLRLIAGLEEVTAGQIFINGEEVSGKNATERGLAMVFQSYALYPHKTVEDNLAFPLKVARISKDEVEKAVKNAAEILKLEPLLKRLPKELSGGQRQRVAIGRCLVRNPKAFLFDEPLSNLDAALRIQMRVEIARLHQQLNTTMVYVTHDQVEAMTMAHRIAVFSEGQIEQVGKPLELYHSPTNLFVAGFIGSPKMNVLPCQPHEEASAVVLPSGDVVRTARMLQRQGTPCHLGIRPEHIGFAPKQEADTQGVVGVAEHLGSDTFVYLDSENMENLIIRLQGDASVQEGQTLGIRFQPEQIHLFDEGGKALTAL